MKLLLLVSAGAPGAWIAYASEIETWERLAEKWGVGIVGLALFLALAYWTWKREERDQEKRDLKDDLHQQERATLAQENNELTREMLTQSFQHTLRLEKLIEQSIEAEKGTQENLAKLVETLNANG